MFFETLNMWRLIKQKFIKHKHAKGGYKQCCNDAYQLVFKMLFFHLAGHLNLNE